MHFPWQEAANSLRSASEKHFKIKTNTVSTHVFPQHSAELITQVFILSVMVHKSNETHSILHKASAVTAANQISF